jgi:hypothetical protein
MTPERYLLNFRPNYTSTKIESLADFLQAVANGEDLWDGGKKDSICYSTESGSGDYAALKALGWSAGADYGSWGSEWMYVYNPHPPIEEKVENED